MQAHLVCLRPGVENERFLGVVGLTEERCINVAVMWRCDVTGHPWVIPVGKLYLWSWVRVSMSVGVVGLELPMDYPCYALVSATTPLPLSLCHQPSNYSLLYYYTSHIPPVLLITSA